MATSESHSNRVFFWTTSAADDAFNSIDNTTLIRYQAEKDYIGLPAMSSCRKKGKCDGKKPVCSTCENAAATCEWPDPELDGRKHKKMTNATRARKPVADFEEEQNRRTPISADDEDHYYRKNQHSVPRHEFYSERNGHHPGNHDIYEASSSSHQPRARHSHGLSHSTAERVADRRHTSSPPSFSHPQSRPSSQHVNQPSIFHLQAHSSGSLGHPPVLQPPPPPVAHVQSPFDLLLAAALPQSGPSVHHQPQAQWGPPSREYSAVGNGNDMNIDHLPPPTRPMGLNTSMTNEPSLVLHYNRAFGPTAIQPGLEKISIAFSAPIPGSRAPSPVHGQSPSTSTSPTVAGASCVPDPYNLSSSFSYEPIHYTNSTSSTTQTSPPNLTTDFAPPQITVTSSDSPYDPYSDIPKPIVLQKLLPLFFQKMGSHFPFITEASLLSNLDCEDPAKRVTAPLIINAVCALGARFSDIPITRTQAQTLTPVSLATYGIPFAEKIKQLLVPLLGFPTTNTVAALLFLAYFSFGLNNEGALWMYSGMALRMALDLGLHHVQASPASVPPTAADVQRASDRLLWWSCFILDRTLAFGTGRPVTVKDREIKASLPTEEEILLVHHPKRLAGIGDPSASTSNDIDGERAPSPFPYHVRMFQLYGALAETINVVGAGWQPPTSEPPSRDPRNDNRDGDRDGKNRRNGRDVKEDGERENDRYRDRDKDRGRETESGREREREEDNEEEPTEDDATNLAEVEDMITSVYHALPELMVFSADNLRIHAKNMSSPTFLALHLWYNTIIIMLYRPPLIHSRVNAARSTLQDRLAVVNNSCLAITNILNSADLVDPFAYLASPFVNQCFFVAGSAWIQDHRIRTGRDVLASSSSSNDSHPFASQTSNSRTPSHSPAHGQQPHHKLLNSSTGILAQMAITNFKLCKKALSRQSTYWMGVRWIEAVVDKYASSHPRANRSQNSGGLSEGVDTFVSSAEMSIFRRLVKRTTGESPDPSAFNMSEESLQAVFSAFQGGLGQQALSEDDWALAYCFASFTARAGGLPGGTLGMGGAGGVFGEF